LKTAFITQVIYIVFWFLLLKEGSALITTLSATLETLHNAGV